MTDDPTIAEINRLTNELAKFEPYGTGNPSTMDQTIEGVTKAMIGWRWRALRAEAALERAYERLRQLDAGASDGK